jgi:hypothetical protein
MPQLKLAANDPMPEAKNLKKRTMVKDVVGQVRATTYMSVFPRPLPPGLTGLPLDTGQIQS